MRESTVVIECDGPGCPARRQGRPGETVEQLRAAMAEYGTWGSKGDRDLCSTCLAQGVRL